MLLLCMWYEWKMSSKMVLSFARFAVLFVDLNGSDLPGKWVQTNKISKRAVDCGSTFFFLWFTMQTPRIIRKFHPNEVTCNESRNYVHIAVHFLLKEVVCVAWKAILHGCNIHFSYGLRKWLFLVIGCISLRKSSVSEEINASTNIVFA